VLFRWVASTPEFKYILRLYGQGAEYVESLVSVPELAAMQTSEMVHDGVATWLSCLHDVAPVLGVSAPLSSPSPAPMSTSTGGIASLISAIVDSLGTRIFSTLTQTYDTVRLLGHFRKSAWFRRCSMFCLARPQIILLSYLLSTLFNGILVAQMLYYWNVDKPTAVKVKTKVKVRKNQ
jgi:hypothetical protein